MPRARIYLLATLAGGLLISAPMDARAQVSPPLQVPPGYVLQPEGTLVGAVVLDVKIVTVSDIGPYTAFLVQPPEKGAKREWFYVRNDNSVKGMERGSIIGLLLGAAEMYQWQDSIRTVNIRYQTVAGRKEIVAASIGARL